MAYSILSQGGVTGGYLQSFCVDKREDIETLPVAPDCKSGSDCLVIEDSTVWMLNTEGTEWKELGAG